MAHTKSTGRNTGEVFAVGIGHWGRGEQMENGAVMGKE